MDATTVTHPHHEPTAMDGDILALRHIRHQYGARVALNDVSFGVRRGEIFGLLGPNGGGKTTLFRILSTMMRPSQGAAYIDGIDVVADPDGARRRLGVVFQSPSVDGLLTVMENVRCQGRLYGLGGGDLRARSDEVLRQFGLSDRARDRVGTLSGGLRRRVELAKGILHRPALLLLDEPSTGLDPGARHDVWQVLEDLRTHYNVTAVLTTHFMDEADRCDRIAILDRGSLVALGKPDDLKSEIGGDVVTIHTREPEALCAAIQERFSCPARTTNGDVRVERRDGQVFLAEVVRAFPDRVDAITLGKPTLEDVFFEKTGHGFWTRRTEEEAA